MIYNLHNITMNTSIDIIKKILNNTSIFDKIEYSKITKNEIRLKIDDLCNNHIPNRTVLLNITDNNVLELWFKNWLHPKLKHAVKKSPSNKQGISKKVLMMDIERDSLRFYENGQFNYTYTIDDIIQYINN